MVAIARLGGYLEHRHKTPIGIQVLWRGWLKLHFFHGQNVVILAHAIIKEDNQVPDREIDLALTYKNLFILNSEVHTYIEPEEETDEEN